ncbi:MAG TPA: hypothetical protein VGA99_12650 [bacterium]
MFLKTGHSDRVNALAVSPDGRLFASASADNTVKIWDAERGELLRTLTGHVADVFAVAFSPRGQILASAGYDSKIVIWNFEGGEVLHTLEHQRQAVTALAFSPDGAWLASAGRDSLVKIWDVSDWSQAMVLSGHDDRVNSVAFSSDGQWLASAALDGTVKLWSVLDWRLFKTLHDHSAGVRAIAFSPDNRLLASASEDQSVKIWEVDTGILVRTLIGFAGTVNAVAFSPNGRDLASAGSDKTIKLWDINTWTLFRDIPQSDEVLTLMFSPDGRNMLCSLADEIVLCWDVEKESTIFSLQAVALNILDVAFSPDGRTLASAHKDGAVKLWDVAQGRWLTTLLLHSAPVNSVAFSPDGRLLAAGSSDSTIAILEVATEEVVLNVKRRSGGIYSLAFLPDGGKLVSAGSEKAIRFWDVNSGRLLKTLFGHGASVNSLNFSPDGHLLASASDDYTVKLWDVSADSLWLNLKGHTLLVKSVQFSPNGQLLASASSDNTVKLWDVRTGALLRTLADHASSVRAAVFSPNGRFLASGGFDNMIRIWQVENGQGIHTLSGHSNDINSLSFSPDGKLLASAGPDGAIHIWDGEFGELRVCLVNLPENEWLIYHPHKLVYYGSAAAERFAALRFGNQLQRVLPLSGFKNQLRREAIIEALFSPQPIIAPEIVQPSNGFKAGYWLGIVGLSVVGIGLIVWLLRNPDDSATDLVRRFFSAAGYTRIHNIGENLLAFDSTNDEPAAMVYICRDGAVVEYERVAKTIRQNQRRFPHGLKLFLIYHNRDALAKAPSPNGDVNHTAIPVHVSALVQPKYTIACRQKLRELERPYQVAADPYREDEPIRVANYFFGREELLHRLPTLIAARIHIGIFGLPRVGKSSLLSQLRLVLKNSPSVLIDLHSHHLRADFLFELILRQLHVQLSLMGIERLPGKSALLGKPFPQSVAELLSVCRRSGHNDPFVFMIDGLDRPMNLMRSEGGERVSAEYYRFFAAIQELAERFRDVVLVVGGAGSELVRNPVVGKADTANPLYRLLTEEYVDLLCPRDSEKILQEMGSLQAIKWHPDAVGRVYHHCGGHPWMIRSFASLVSRQGSLRDIDINMVEETARKCQETWSENEIGRFLRGEILPVLTSEERELLKLLGQSQDGGFPVRNLSPRFSAALTELENFGLIGNDLGRIGVVGEFFKSFFSQPVAA